MLMIADMSNQSFRIRKKLIRLAAQEKIVTLPVSYLTTTLAICSL
jgi:hypothetical protein